MVGRDGAWFEAPRSAEHLTMRKVGVPFCRHEADDPPHGEVRGRRPSLEPRTPILTPGGALR